MSKDRLVVVAVQMISNDQVDQNLESAIRLIREAKAAVVDRFGDIPTLITLPENALCFSARYYAELAEQAEQYIAVLADLARELNVELLIGSIPSASRPDGTLMDSKLRSSSILIESQGKVVARYDKIHLFDVDVDDLAGAYRESDDFEHGEEAVVCKAGELTIGMSICYDLRFPGLYQALRRDGAEVILVPAAFTHVTGEAHWEVLLRARAIETQCYVVAPNQGGKHSTTRETWGHSMIVDPWGKVVASLEKGEGFCMAEIDRNLITQSRQKMPVQNHARFISQFE